MPKKPWFLMILLTVALTGVGCGGGSKTGANCLSGRVSFGGEPESALPLPSPGPVSMNRKRLFPRTAPMNPNPSTSPSSLVVSLEPQLSEAEQRGLLAGIGFRILRRMLIDPNSYVVTSESLSIDVAYNLACKTPGIRRVEYNRKLLPESVVIPNDPNYESQWDMRLTKFDWVWDDYPGRDPVIVAVLDTGIYPESPEFSGRLTIVPGSDMVSDDDQPWDDVKYNDDCRYSHGTNVAGIIAANTGNRYGYAGAAGNAPIQIMPIRVLGPDNGGDIADITDGIYLAVLNHAKVINLSLGTAHSFDSDLFNHAVEYAASKDVLLVCAAGNNGGPIDYPARLAGIYDNVIAVGAATSSGQRSSFSAVGPELTVLAPGGEEKPPEFVWNITFDKFNQVEVLNHGMAGTSQATPHVSALAALLCSYGMPAAEVKSVIAATATDLGVAGRDDQYGSGMINAFAALVTASGMDLSAVTVGLRDPVTHADRIQPVHPDSSGNYRIPNPPRGRFELYGIYPLDNGYRYYRTVPVFITGPAQTQNLILQLVPKN